MAARGNRSLLFIDLGVPRNVAPEAAELYNIYLYGVDDLKDIVEQNKRAREAEIPKVEALVEEHLGKFESWQAGVEAGVVVRELRSRLGAEREAFLRERLGDVSHLSPEDQQRIALLMDDLLHSRLACARRAVESRSRPAPQNPKSRSAQGSLPPRPG